jgi:limonene-1,2-epoxide hydrolase
MMGSATEIIDRFGAIEADQRYTQLVDLFTDDAIYCDPFAGPQIGKTAIATFMAEMERVIPKMGVFFADWETVAESSVGWARWTMVIPVDGVDHPVKGQSLYRLRDGKVCYVADYVDSVAQAKIRPNDQLDLGVAASQIKGTTVEGRAAELIRRFWALQTDARYSELASLFAADAVFTDQVYGRFEGHQEVANYLARMEHEMPAQGVRFTLDDLAGDDQVGWSQWTCHMAQGSIPGWTLHTVRDGLFTLDADYFDVWAARRASPRQR